MSEGLSAEEKKQVRAVAVELVNKKNYSLLDALLTAQEMFDRNNLKTDQDTLRADMETARACGYSPAAFSL